MKKIADIAYASSSDSQKLDLYLPDNSSGKRLPLLFFIHGGGFSKGDKAQGTIMDLVNYNCSDFIIASINYRLSGEAPFPAGIEDSKAAVKYLKAHGKKYNIDTKKIAIIGSSAGGNYALMLGLDQALLKNFEKKCIVAIYPVVDLLSMQKLTENLNDNDPIKSYMIKNAEMYFHKNVADITAEDLKSASPLFQLSEHLPSTLLQHGTEDDTAPFSLTKEFYEQAKALGVSVEFDIFEHAGHSDKAFKTRENMLRVLNFVRSNLN